MPSYFRNFLVLVAGLIALMVVGCSTATPPNANSNTGNRAPANAANLAGSPNTTNANTSSPTKPFSQTLDLHGIKFVVESPNSAADNALKVTPSGLEISNDVQMKPVKGEVYGAEIGDLDIDQSPEIYIYVRETSGNRKASVVVYSANKKRSLSEVTVPDDDPKSKDLSGYNGGDEFAIIENSLARRFPIFDGIGSEAKKTGKMRQFRYKLKQGEASWQLALDKVTKF